MRDCRARLDSLERQLQVGWETPAWFSSLFLPWEDGAASADFSPNETLTCQLVAHDLKWGRFAHISHVGQHAAWPLEDGRWRATVSWRAKDLEPVTHTVELDSAGNLRPGAAPGTLAFVGFLR